MLHIKKHFVKAILMGVFVSTLLFSNNVKAATFVSYTMVTSGSATGRVMLNDASIRLSPVNMEQITTATGTDPLVSATYQYYYEYSITPTFRLTGYSGTNNDYNLYYGYLNGPLYYDIELPITVSGANTSGYRVWYEFISYGPDGVISAINSIVGAYTSSPSLQFKTYLNNCFVNGDTTEARFISLCTIKVHFSYVGSNDGAHTVSITPSVSKHSDTSIIFSTAPNSQGDEVATIISAIDNASSVDEIASILYQISNNTYLLNQAIYYLTNIDADLTSILNKLDEIKTIDANSYARLGLIYNLLYDYIYNLNATDTEAQSQMGEAEEEMSRAAEQLQVSQPDLDGIFQGADNIIDSQVTQTQGVIMGFLTYSPILTILLLCFTVAIISYIIYGKSG